MRHVKLKLWLPSVQVLIAAVLIATNRLMPSARRNPFTSWERPDRQLCDAINAPAALIRWLLIFMTDKLLPNVSVSQLIEFFILEIAVFLILVAVLWYLVSVEIAGEGKGPRVSAITRKTPARPFLDVLFVLFGAALLWAGQIVRHQFGSSPSGYSNLISIPYFVWGAVAIAFYGYDLLADLIERSRGREL